MNSNKLTARIAGFHSMSNLTEEEIKELKAIRLRKYKPSIIFLDCVVERMRLNEK